MTAQQRATRARRAQQRVVGIDWPGERNRLLMLYQELLENS
jgi:hypothetical protein